jgi:Trk K+ transport system NAD-binding subunit
MLLSIASHVATIEHRRPLVVAEVFDASKAPIARSAYSGPIEIVSSDAVIARLIAQNLRHRGLSQVFHEILSHGIGSEVCVRECPGLRGRRFFELDRAFPQAIPLGLIRPGSTAAEPLLNPPPNTEVCAGDRLVFLAPSYEATAPAPVSGSARQESDYGERAPPGREAGPPSGSRARLEP